jgi:hypothetical protein
MGKTNEKSASSESLRRELRDIDEAVAMLEAQVVALEAEVKRRLLLSLRDVAGARDELKSAKAKLARAKFELKDRRELRPALLDEIAAAEAAETIEARKELARELEDIAQAVARSGEELDKHFRGLIDALRALEDGLSRGRQIGHIGINREMAQTALKDLVRSQLGALPELGLPLANKRWTGRELCGGWAGAIRGTSKRLMEEQAPPVKLNGSKPKLSPRVDIGRALPGDGDDFEVHEDAVALRRSHEQAMRGTGDA